MYARQLKEKIDVSALVRNATGILLSMATLISALCWWYADDIMHLVYSDIDCIHIQEGYLHPRPSHHLLRSR